MRHDDRPRASALVLADGTILKVRSIGPDDREALAAGFARLSARSREQRFLMHKDRLTQRELTHLTTIDHRGHEALVAIDPRSGDGVAVARYAGWSPEGGAAELAVTVDDRWQRRGVGTALCRRLLDRAREEGVERLEATTRADNRGCQALLRRLGFRHRGTVRGLADFDLDLTAGEAPAALAA